MKKIHITEAQLECLRKKLSEGTIATEANPVEFRVQDQDGNGRVGQTDIENAAKQVQSLVGTGNLNKTELTVNPKQVTVGSMEEGAKPITKKQIKEAKIKKLRENSEVFKKSDLR